MLKAILIAVGLSLVTAGAATAQRTHSRAASKPVTVELKNARGQIVGTALLSEASHGVKIKLDIKGLLSGEHSLHIHEHAKCEPPDFKSAGAHFGAMAMGHDNHDHSAMPAGDIPNFSLVVAADGTAHVTVVAPGVTLGSGDNSVFTDGGTSIIIHEVSGGISTSTTARIACGVITKPE